MCVIVCVGLVLADWLVRVGCLVDLAGWLALVGAYAHTSVYGKTTA